jgi:hypothetical protein
VAVRAGAAIAFEAMRRTIEEGKEAAEHGFTRLAAAGSRMLDLRRIFGAGGGSQQQRRHDKKDSPGHMFLPLRLRNRPQRNLAARHPEIVVGSMKNPDLLCS